MESGEFDQKQAERNLTKVKNDRKMIEQDAQLLANRIALLKQEEMRSWKKIEETRRKAQEVYFLKKKNEERLVEKSRRRHASSLSTRQTQLQSNDLRKNKELERSQLHEALSQHKKEEMLQIKRQREINESKKREYEQRLKQENQIRHNEIMTQKIIAEQRKKEIMEQKMRFFKMQYEQRLREEEEAKAKRELEVLNMEKLEMEMIKKLQHTQMIQKSAYEELETALANNPDDFAKKYTVQRVNDGRNRKLSTRNSVSPLHKDDGKGDMLGGLDDSKDLGSYKGVAGTNPQNITGRDANAEQAVLQSIQNRQAEKLANGEGQQAGAQNNSQQNGTQQTSNNQPNANNSPTQKSGAQTPQNGAQTQQNSAQTQQNNAQTKQPEAENQQAQPTQKA